MLAKGSLWEKKNKTLRKAVTYLKKKLSVRMKQPPVGKKLLSLDAIIFSPDPCDSVSEKTSAKIEFWC